MPPSPGRPEFGVVRGLELFVLDACSTVVLAISTVQCVLLLPV